MSGFHPFVPPSRANKGTVGIGTTAVPRTPSDIPGRAAVFLTGRQDRRLRSGSWRSPVAPAVAEEGFRHRQPLENRKDNGSVDNAKNNTDKPRFTGWHRPSPSRPWQRVVEAESDAECWDLLNASVDVGEIAVTEGGNHPSREDARRVD